MDTGDAVTEYRDCVCVGVGCSCVPSMVCGSTSVCVRGTLQQVRSRLSVSLPSTAVTRRAV